MIMKRLARCGIVVGIVLFAPRGRAVAADEATAEAGIHPLAAQLDYAR